MNEIVDQDRQAYTQEITREFFKNVYAYMFAAMVISGLVAYSFGTPEFFMKHFVNASGTGTSTLFYVVMFAPIG
ncbi:MAG TPA: hypothetical protein EYG86_04245, partial [Crocinitomicaceae bacterium]|nr:hypothetical protein [Crocinitomicaceae bacterium]